MNKHLHFPIIFLLTCILRSGGQNYFQVTYGSTTIGEYGQSVVQTSDGGYIMAGYTSLIGPVEDVYIVKSSSDGVMQWARTVGGTNNERGESVRQTSDGGYIISGRTNSFGAGNADVYLVRMAADGSLRWARTFGGTGFDDGASVRQTSDGGYIITGITASFGSGSNDVFFIKTNAVGDISPGNGWAKTFGGGSADNGMSVIQTSDGGYLISGETASFGTGGNDAYLIKTNLAGNIGAGAGWTKTFGGTANEYARSLWQTSDGGYIVAGGSYSFGAGLWDLYLIKINSAGSMAGGAGWNKTYGMSAQEHSWSVQQTADGGYMIGGQTDGSGATGVDAYLMKVNSSGSYQWSWAYTTTGNDYAYSTVQTSDGGYMVFGATTSFQPGYDFYMVKTDADGLVGGCNTRIPLTPSFSQGGNESTGGVIVVPAVTAGSGGSEGIQAVIVKTPCPALAIELISFSAHSEGENVILEWSTASETNNAYFTIERSFDGTAFSVIGAVQGAGNSVTSRYYEFTDAITDAYFLSPVDYIYYRLKQVDYDGGYSLTGTVKVHVKVKVAFSIRNIITSGGLSVIRFTMPSAGEAGYEILDLTGGRMLAGSFGQLQEGNLSVSISTSDLPAGIYGLFLKSGRETASGRMLLY